MTGFFVVPFDRLPWKCGRVDWTARILSINCDSASLYVRLSCDVSVDVVVVVASSWTCGTMVFPQ
jgi:hypothetical protein